MGQSLSQMYIHLVFGTKNRYPFIAEKIAPNLHGFIAGILKKMDSPAIIINSMPDHIHIFFCLSKNHSLADVVEEIKKTSSVWMKVNGVPGFYWQPGYGSFSVSGSKVKIVERYIQQQQEHHLKMSFQEEVERFFKEYNVAGYDPVYFWK